MTKSKIINSIELDETLHLTECLDGFWLYDKTRSMNLSMHAKTKDAAFYEALKYYQKRLLIIEAESKLMKDKLKNFIESFSNTVED